MPGLQLYSHVAKSMGLYNRNRNYRGGGWNRQGTSGWNRQYPINRYRKRPYRRGGYVSKAIRRARWFSFARKVKSAMRGGKKTENTYTRTTTLVPNNTVTAANYDLNWNLPALGTALTVDGDQRIYQKALKGVMELKSSATETQIIDLYLICNNNPQCDASTDFLSSVSGMGVPMGPGEIAHELRKAFTVVYHRQFTLQPQGEYESQMFIPHFHRKLGRYLTDNHNQGAMTWYAKSNLSGVLSPARIVIQQSLSWESRIGSYS